MTDDELVQHCMEHHALSEGRYVKLSDRPQVLRNLHDKLHKLNTAKNHLHGEDGTAIVLSA